MTLTTPKSPRLHEYVTVEEMYRAACGTTGLPCKAGPLALSLRDPSDCPARPSSTTRHGVPTRKSRQKQGFSAHVIAKIPLDCGALASQRLRCRDVDSAREGRAAAIGSTRPAPLTSPVTNDLICSGPLTTTFCSHSTTLCIRLHA
jgi:hypothetical protein